MFVVSPKRTRLLLRAARLHAELCRFAEAIEKEYGDDGNLLTDAKDAHVLLHGVRHYIEARG